MPGEGGLGGGAAALVGPVATFVSRLVKPKYGSEQRAADVAAAQAPVYAAIARFQAASQPGPPLADPIRASRGAIAGIYGAVQPGAPAGTGSGTTATAPSIGPADFLRLAIAILDYLGQRRASRIKPPSYFFDFGTGGLNVPYFTSSPSIGGAYGSMDPWGSVLSGIGSAGSSIASIINAIRGPQAMPGGMSFVPTTQPGVMGGLAQALTGGNACPTAPFANSASSAVSAQHFVVAHPVTGRAVWFKPAGRPILWSGDLSACRRVRKIAGRARRRLGGR